MSLFFVEIVLFFIALMFAGLFAYLETAFTALRLFKLKELKARVARHHALFASWEQNPQRILITILIANNFAHVLSSVLITEIMQKIFGQGIGLPIGVTLATALILLFGEIIPKSIAKAQYEKLFVVSLWLMSLLFHLFYPFVTILLKIANFFYQWLGGPHALEKHDVVSEKEIEFLIDYSDEKGLMEAEKTEMLQNIFDLGHTLVSDIIVPKTDMILLDVNASLDDALALFAQHRYSRLPVFEGKEENIIGIIYQKDVFSLLSEKTKKPLSQLVRPVLFVPETKRIDQLLREFLEKRMHMSIAIDEYGAVIGLVTLEDVIEEIVGDISDEDEKVHVDVVPLERGGWIVDGRITLDKLSELLGITFKTEESVTLNGFLSEKLQHLPRKGERIFYEGYCFQIQQASRRRVFQVLVFKDKTQITG
jgi:CBS domain containing-hemolysin-like protein